MLPDLAEAHARAMELGLRSRLESRSVLHLSLREDAILYMRNEVASPTCRMGFVGTPWHVLTALMVEIERGCWVDVPPLEVLRGLADGELLVAESWSGDTLQDRWLIHRHFNTALEAMSTGEHVRAWAPRTLGPRNAETDAGLHVTRAGASAYASIRRSTPEAS